MLLEGCLTPGGVGRQPPARGRPGGGAGGRGLLSFLCPRHWERAAQKCLAEPVELEFGAEDGSYSRGYASSASSAAAIRPDILAHVSDRWKDQLAENVRGILQTAWDPKKTFDLRLLTPLFAREVAPYQVLARDTAVFYSPARLVSLGLP